MSKPRLMVVRKSPRCIVCSLPLKDRQEVNAAIWQGTQRVTNYVVAGKRAYDAVADSPCDRKVIMRHADHVERSMREATPEDPAAGREEPVFPTDYESLVDKAAAVGMGAMAQLEAQLAEGLIAPRELVALAKMGVTARAQQRAAEIDSKRPQVLLMGIFGLASGHLAQLPESEAIETFDEATLRLEVREQRRLLEERARNVTPE